jgi:3-hydroxy-9,10-secoandrosta-1,3,5(10)-triene-9,17-dione monooxygenase reductase component
MSVPSSTSATPSSEPTAGISIDSRTFRETVGQFATGVTVVTTKVDDTIRAITVNSFTGLSLDPPLVLFCVSKATKTGQIIHVASGFAANILRQEQQDLSTYFAGGWTRPLPPSFSFLDWQGGPRLEGCAAAIGCAIDAIHEGGDHWIVTGRVLAMHRAAGAAPLIFHGGRYANLGATFESEILVCGF